MEEEFIEILSQYQGILHKVNLIYFKNSIDRQDNFQEIVYQLWKSFPNVKNKKSIGSWIYAISISTAISTLRKKSKIEIHDNLPEIRDLDNHFDRFINNDNLRLLIEAIQNLNEIDKSIMFLYLEDKSHDEISEILGISKTNVGTKINRIRIFLKNKFNTQNQINK
jgi:RNA polymerase sigma-70 factor (ECF subfamily)